MTEPVQVFVRDIRKVRICLSGARWFFKKHDLDWGAFLREGLPESALLATGDHLAEKVVMAARQRVGEADRGRQ